MILKLFLHPQMIQSYMLLRPDLYQEFVQQNGRVHCWKYVGGLVSFKSGAGDCFLMFDEDERPAQPTCDVRRKRRCRRRYRRFPTSSTSFGSTGRHAGRKRGRNDGVEGESVMSELKRLRVETTTSRDNSDEDVLLDYEDYENEES